MLQHLAGVAQAVGASVDSGLLVFSDGAQLTDKLLTSELSSFFAGINARVNAVSSQEAVEVCSSGDMSAQARYLTLPLPCVLCAQDVQMMEMTMLGLQGLAEQQLASSKQAMAQMLSWAVKQLDEAFGGDVTFQVKCLSFMASLNVSNPLEAKSTVQSLLFRLPPLIPCLRLHLKRPWLGGSAPAAACCRVRFMQSTNTCFVSLLQSLWLDFCFVLHFAATALPGEDEEAQARRFAAKAAGYGSFIILLYFMLVGAQRKCRLAERGGCVP